MFTSETWIVALTGIVLPSVLVIFLTFVPSIVEWRRPRDSGPRPIPGFYNTGIVIPKNAVFDLEQEIGAVLVPKGFSFPVFIRNIEATFT